MPRILCVDPGTTQSAWVVWDVRREKIVKHGLCSNRRLLLRIVRGRFRRCEKLFVEMIASYGMPVGKSVFETCVWIGRYVQAWSRSWSYVYRQAVKLEVCGSPRAKDSNIRAALLDRVGLPGTKKSPGPTYGVKKDIWAALGVAVTAAATSFTKRRKSVTISSKRKR